MYKELIDEARKAMKNAYSPYYKFYVGSAVLTKSGKIFSSGNIGAAVGGAEICAERAAIAKAISEGERDFEAVAVVGNTNNPISPCGVCRQFIIEFGENIKIVMVNTKGETIIKSISELLPYPFLKEIILIEQPHYNPIQTLGK
jgi:homotetrameric cytidine deaminase